MRSSDGRARGWARMFAFRRLPRSQQGTSGDVDGDDRNLGVSGQIEAPTEVPPLPEAKPAAEHETAPVTPLPLLVAEGVEGPGSRASIIISALHLAAPRLNPIAVLFVNVRDAAVEDAVTRLRWETGIAATCSPDPLTEDHPALAQQIVLYLAISHFASEAHGRAGNLAARAGAGVLTLQQRPGRDASAMLLLMQRASHDPMALASEIVRLTAHR